MSEEIKNEELTEQTPAAEEAVCEAPEKECKKKTRKLEAQIDELTKKASFITIIDGSMGQKKNEVNPLLSHYDKAQRTFMAQLEALGLNLSARQNKNGQKNKDDEDPLANALNEIKGI